MVASYKNTHQWFALCDMMMSVVVAILTGIRTDDTILCAGLYGGIAFVYVLYLVAIFRCGAFHTPREQAFCFLSSCCTLLSVAVRIFETVSLIPSSDASAAMLSTSTSMMTLNSVWSHVATVYLRKMLNRRHTPAEVSEEENMDQQLQVKLDDGDGVETAATIL
eukprot:PhF_6_TR10353/c0_g1_i2/m.16011